MTTISSVFWLPFPDHLVRIHACLDMEKRGEKNFVQKNFVIEAIYEDEREVTEEMIASYGLEDLTLLAQQYHCYLHQEGLPRC